MSLDRYRHIGIDTDIDTDIDIQDIHVNPSWDDVREGGKELSPRLARGEISYTFAL